MDFAAMLHTWINVLTKPGEATLADELGQPQAKLSTAVIWVVIAGAIAAVFSGISAAISGLMGGTASMMAPLLEQMPPEVQSQMGQYMAKSAGGVAGAGSAFCMTLVVAPIAFLIGSALWFGLAKLFGGTGNFEEQTYLLGTFTAPIMIITSALGVIPFIGGCIGFLVSIYQIVLTYYALKLNHNLTSGKALTVVLVPMVLLLLCMVCGIGMAVMTAGLAAAS